jgi:hypothetical protein
MGSGTGRHRKTSGGRHVPAWDHQAVALAHRVGVGDAEHQLVLQQHVAAALQRAEHTAFLAVAVADLHAGEVGAALLPWQTPSRLPALQRKQSPCRLRVSSEPPWFYRCAEGCA